MPSHAISCLGHWFELVTANYIRCWCNAQSTTLPPGVESSIVTACCLFSFVPFLSQWLNTISHPFQWVTNIHCCNLPFIVNLQTWRYIGLQLGTGYCGVWLWPWWLRALLASCILMNMVSRVIPCQLPFSKQMNWQKIKQYTLHMTTLSFFCSRSETCMCFLEEKSGGKAKTNADIISMQKSTGTLKWLDEIYCITYFPSLNKHLPWCFKI